ncbi:sialate O-acetylesterase [Mucilaginibacter gracilis]|nr:sialate O-acetylesterase [Mucilaginibacter gracilis]
MKNHPKLLLIAFLLCAGFKSECQIRLPQLVANGMVLQRDREITLWGWANAGEKVTIKLLNKTYHTTTALSGTWTIKLPALKAGGPYMLDIQGTNHIQLSDVMVGDVWFCSGQSNMAVPMERVKEKYPDEIATANFPDIRNFFVPTLSDVSNIHADLPPGKWMKADPQNVLAFGAASYFFAKQLYLKYHVPIGIINSSVGGTPIQAWISAEGIKNIQPYAGRLKQLKDTAFLNNLIHPPNKTYSGAPQPTLTDQGLTGPIKWFDTAYQPKGWHNFWLPGYWADEGVKGLNGVVWFRKEIDLPANLAGKAAKLFLGRIVDADETYVNGIKVGNITYQYPPRRYTVAEGILKPGKNIIVVRLINTSGKGGFVPDKTYQLSCGETNIDLRGDWKYQVGLVYPPPVPGTMQPPPFSAQNEPSGLYNTMVAPAINYAIKGFVWYQGEANTSNPKEYKQLLPALIANWREKWGVPNSPFLYAQLPNFMEVQYSPSESQWAQLREAQRQTLDVPNTAMAVTIDGGEWNDIHPLNKKVVGDRLALLAQKLAYGDASLVSGGPLYQSSKKEGSAIVISFTNVGSGLAVNGGGELSQFAIAGADKRFVWAKAKIQGDKVMVWSEQVPSPAYVRYAWADNPEGANLYNNEGLPASPFSTDEL